MARKITLLTYVWKEASWNFSVSGTTFLRSVFTIQVIDRVIDMAKGLILQEGDNSSICSLIFNHLPEILLVDNTLIVFLTVQKSLSPVSGI